MEEKASQSIQACNIDEAAVMSVYFQTVHASDMLALLERGLEKEQNKILQRNLTAQIKGLRDEAKLRQARLDRAAKEAAERAKGAKGDS